MGLGQMLQQDREQRRALRQAELQARNQKVTPNIGSMGDKGGTPGAFQKYPTQPPPS